MTRICHVITSLKGGGTENFLFQIISGSPPNFDHRVIYLKELGAAGQKIQALKIPVEHAPTFSVLVKLLRSYRPDVLHTCLYRAHQVGRVAGRVARVPLIVSSQRAIDAWQKPWHRWVDSMTLNAADVVIANSEAAASFIAKRPGVLRRPTVVKINNGIDPWRRTLMSKDEARKLLNLPSNALLGGTLSRLHMEKGADRIAHFAGRLLERHPDLHLVVGGDGPLAEMLRRDVSGHPWSKRLYWLGWMAEPLKFLSAIDFFWLLSREESFPQALLEASASGVPWMATDVGGVSELAASTPGSLLLRSGDASSMADEAEQMISEFPARSAIAADAAASVLERFSIDKMVHAFYDVITSQLER